jgi:lysophospholipase L1-like esterase
MSTTIEVLKPSALLQFTGGISPLASVCEKLASGISVSFAFEGDSLLYGQTTGGEPTIAAINGAVQLRSETPIPESFAQILAFFSASSIVVHNRGFPGDETAQWEARWGASPVADVTFINYLLNDANNYGLNGGSTIEEYQENLAEIVQTRRLAGSAVILLASPIEQTSASNKTRRYRMEMENIARAMGVPFFDMGQMLEPRQTKRADNLHLDARQYAEIACALAALFTPLGFAIDKAAPGVRLQLRTGPAIPYIFATGGSVAALRETGGIDVGSTLVDRWLPLNVTEPCRVMFEVNAAASAANRNIRIGYGAKIANKGDGTAAADPWRVEAPRDWVENAFGTSSQPAEPMRGPILYPGPRLLSLTNDASTTNHYITGILFEPVDLPLNYIQSLPMEAPPLVVPDTGTLNPGTGTFAATVVIGGPGLYPNPAATIVLFDKITGNTGYKLELTTARLLVLTIGNGASLSTWTSTLPISYDNHRRTAVGFLFIRSIGVYFHQDGESLGIAQSNTSFGAASVSSVVDLTVLGAATRIYTAGVFVSIGTVDFVRLMTLLQYGPTAGDYVAFLV